MAHPHHTTHRSALGRFVRGFFRLLWRPFRILWRLIKGKRSNKEMLRLAVLGTGIGLAIFALLAVAAIAFFSRGLPDPDKLIDRNVAQSTKIYDRSGEHLLYEISGEQKRTVVKVDDLPPYITQAVIALEDRTFYEHSGFNFQRLIKAAMYKAIGRSGPGASTLTSQLVKNVILSPEKTLTRKLREMILTFQIERKFTKPQILQMYLNEIPYGSTAYGVQAASQLYFGKDAKDVSLGEAALLAAIIQRPTYFSPYGSHVDALLDRKDLTLALMKDQGYITDDEKKAAQAQELVFKERRENIDAPHFVFYVRDLLVERYGEHLVNRGGLVVRTSLDFEKQQMAEQAITDRVEFNKGFEASNASLVSLDVKTGEVLAMVGSIDYFNDEVDGKVNVSLRPRQPGSSFKPVVYTLAWQRGYTPSTVIFDVNTDFPGAGKLYQPKNYDLKEHGPMSLRNSLQGSLNIPAVKMLYLVGVSNVLDFADQLGYTTLKDRSRFGLSLVLGGGEVTLLEHTSAYATLAGEGLYRAPLPILEVRTNDGQVLDTFLPQEKRVIDTNIARITTNVLSDNGARAYVFGANNGLTLPGRQAAAKTGTTNDYRDAWTLGYVPSLATGVWVGNNDFSEMKRGGGSSLAAPIWNAYMQAALKDVPAENFTTPQIPVPDKPILSGQGFGVTQVTVDRATGKLATPLTPDTYREEKLYIDAHDILYYVDKRNPTGPAPVDPVAADSQFIVWETAVQNWIKARVEKNEPIFSKENVSFPEGVEIEYGVPPTEPDDVHVEANIPSLSIITPPDDARLTERFISVTIEANASRGISRVEFYLDGTLLGTDASYPFGIESNLKSFQNGFYRLRVIAYDDVDNSREASRRLQLQSEESFIGLDWEEPEADSHLAFDAENILLRLNITANEHVNQVTFFAIKVSTGEDQLINAVLAPDSQQVKTLWKPATPGDYRLYAKVSVDGVGVLTSAERRVTVDEAPAVVDGG